MKVRSQTYLENRDGTYYFRRPVPAELRPVIGKSIRRWSLKTKDKDKAKRLVELATVKTSLEFDQARRRLRPITTEEAKVLAQSAYTAVLKDDEEARIGATESDLEELAASNDALIDAVEEARPTPLLRSLAEEALAAADRPAPDDPDSMARLLHFVRIEARKAAKALALRDAGEDIDTPTVNPQGVMLLSQLIERWVTSKGVRAKSAEEARSTLKRFVSVHGDLPISTITKRHGADYRDRRLQEGRAPGTVRKDIGLVSAALNFAAGSDFIAVNPWSGLALPDKRKKVKERRPFKPDELRTLCTHQSFTSRERGEPALYWLPLMSLYSGARLEELGQLRLADFHMAHGLGVYFEISGRVRDVKNPQSVRAVPVHPLLVRLGLLDYLKAQRKAGVEFLFPNLKPRKHGERTQALSHAFGRLLDKVDLSDPALDFHSLRHTFITYARESGIGDDVRRALTGHDAGDVHEGYGAHTLHERFAAIKRYRVPGLSLRRV